jgi:hypothetical protein
MLGLSDFDAARERGAGVPAPAELARLYEKAFAEFGTLALWSYRAAPNPTVAGVLRVAATLRREGNMRARDLADAMEELALAAL